jgi:hypothetical protein
MEPDVGHGETKVYPALLADCRACVLKLTKGCSAVCYVEICFLLSGTERG